MTNGGVAEAGVLQGQGCWLFLSEGRRMLTFLPEGVFLAAESLSDTV